MKLTGGRKSIRNLQFAKNEALFAAKQLKKVGGLKGRSPKVETEI
jgi:hypothetical protein